jgi:hypothetical protein
MKLNISEERADIPKIDAAIGKWLTHGTTIFQMRDFANQAEKLLDKIKLPKADRSGVQHAFYSGSVVPNRYRHERSTHCVLLERGTRDWYLKSVYRTTQSPSQGHRAETYLTKKQRDIVVRQFTKQFTVLKDNALETTAKETA